MSCNSWSCPHCGKIKKNRIVDRVKSGFDADLIIPGHRIRSITLTQKFGSVRNIMKDWAVMRVYLGRLGYHVKYFWCKEFTVKGQRHLHAIINAYIPQPVLKDCWSRATCGESYIVWITGQNSKLKEIASLYNPAGYASKYLTKSYSTETKFDNHEHRYGFCRDSHFKAQPRQFNPTPIEAMEKNCLGTPWTADLSQIAIIKAYRLSHSEVKT